MTEHGARPRVAGTGDSGRTCPYCRFALKPGTAIVDCGVCSASHHDECWSDNHGCAMLGCAGQGTAVTAALPPPAGPPATPPAYAPQRPPPPAPAAFAAGQGSSSAGGNRGLVAALVALAVVVAGAAAAVVLTRDTSGAGDPQPSVAVTVTVPSPGSATTGDETADLGGGSTTTPADEPAEGRTAPDPEPAPPPPPPPPAARAADIQPAVQHYYGAVRAGNFDRAWSLLSPSYKSWKEREGGGYAKWQQQERRNRARLRVGTVSVDVRSFDERSGVATIHISGMRLEQRDGSLCAYEGITWARRAGAGWLYDQGYLQNAAREAKWRPRKLETLGVACDETGY